MAKVDDLILKRRMAMDEVVARIASERGLELSMDLRRDLGDAAEVAYQQFFKPLQMAQPNSHLSDVETLLRRVYEIDTLICTSRHDDE